MAQASLPPAESWLDQLVQKLLDVIVQIPATAEPASQTPEVRCRAIIRGAALKTAGTSGSLALLPGPWGMLTVLPDLVAVWKIQAQMVADIAAAYGKTALLSPEQMLYCLFRQTASQAVRDLVVRLGDRLAIRRVPLRVIQRALRQIGLEMTQQLAGRTTSRWLPVIGALGVAAYAYRDTRRVGHTAIELFSREVALEDDTA
jgi:EcsC protein family